MTEYTCEFWDKNGPPFCTLTGDDECPYPTGGCYESDDEPEDEGCSLHDATLSEQAANWHWKDKNY